MTSYGHKNFYQASRGLGRQSQYEVAVGEDLEFQRKWWRFENAAWVFFTLIIILTYVDCLDEALSPRRSAIRRMEPSETVKYERIERTDSPSILSLSFGQSAVQRGKFAFTSATAWLSRWEHSGSFLRRKRLSSVRAGLLIPFRLRTARQRDLALAALRPRRL